MRALLLLLLLAPGAATASSFDCGRAASATERAVCSDPTLSREDEELAQAYKRSQRVFDSSGPGAAAVLADLRESQGEWLRARDRCGAERQCLAHAYSDRLAVLEFRGRPGRDDPADRAAGRYRHGGFIDLWLQVRTDDTLRVALFGAEPSAAKWVCSFGALGRVEDGRVQAGALEVRLGPGGASIPDTDANRGLSDGNCGLNGSLVWDYVKQAPAR